MKPTLSTAMQQEFEKDWNAADTNDERKTVIHRMEFEKLLIFDPHESRKNMFVS